MAELVIGASYPARRNGQIAVSMNPETKSLMVYIPFALCGMEFSGVQSINIGTKAGVLNEVALQNLREIFNWQTENPFDLQRLPQPESQDAEFTLADCFIDSYTPKGKTDAIESYKFRWLNKLGGGIKVSTDDEESEAMKVWGAKFNFAPSTPKAEKKSAAKTAPSRKVPTKTAAKEPRKSSAEEVMELLIKKHYPNGDATDDQQQKLGDDFYFPAQDKLFGQNVSAETPEQWGQVANELGL